MDKTYRLNELCETLNIKPGRIQNWLLAGWITPSVQVAAGSGSRNIFSYDDLLRVEMLRTMIEMGIPRKYAGEVIAWAQTNKVKRSLDKFAWFAKTPNTFFEVYILPDGKVIGTLMSKASDFWEKRKKFNPVIVYSINLNFVIEKVAQAVKGK